MSFKQIGIIAACVVAAIVFATSVGYNDSTEQTVTQNIMGAVEVHSDSGPWFSLLAKSQSFPKSASFYFSASDDEGSEHDAAVDVSFKNSSGGKVSGSVRYTYPVSPEQMKHIFGKYGNPHGVQSDLVRNVVRNIVTMNASMMSPEAAMSQKGKFQQDFLDQLLHGQFVTKIEEEVEEDLITHEKKQHEVVSPVIDEKGQIVRLPNVAKELGISFDTVTITLITVDDKTKDQIAQRRDAEMKVIVAKAEQEKAEQEKLRVIAEGQKEVEARRYEGEQQKVRETVDAERAKAVATIEAQKKVDVATLANQQRKAELENAKLEAAAKVALADAQAYEKKKLLEADNALQSRLDAWVKAQQYWAEAFANRKVPTTMIGGAETGGHSDAGAANFMNLITARLGLDISKGGGSGF